MQVELKAKKLGVCKKTRFQISQAAFEKMKNGEKIEFNHELLLLNLNMKEETLVKRVEKVNTLINTLKLKPKMQVVYHRLAFQKDNFRATIDSNIQFNSINAVNAQYAEEMKSSDLWKSAQHLLSKFKQDQFVVLELKHTEEIPTWIKNLLIETQIKKTGFSKYGWSISDIISKMQ
ncbi:MAG: VTC domain-containing protein [Bacteriovoracaceae bacterium]